MLAEILMKNYIEFVSGPFIFDSSEVIVKRSLANCQLVQNASYRQYIDFIIVGSVSVSQAR
jgi:hypothetical protein